MAPKPSFSLTQPGSAFGFKPQKLGSTMETITSDYTTSGRSTQCAEVVPDSQSNPGQSQDPVGRDLDPSTNDNYG